MQDSFGRSIDYLRISVTDRCNLGCRYCMPEEGFTLLPWGKILSYEQFFRVAEAAMALGFTKIRLTGSEPLMRRDIARLVAMLAPLPGLLKLAMTTNGTLLAPMAADLRRAGLMSVNISLDTLSPELYAYITRGGDLCAALTGVRAAVAAGLEVKINTVVLDPAELEAGVPAQDIEAVRTFALELGAGHQRIAQYHLDRQKLDSEDYERPPRCGTCNRLRLLADGTLRACLHSNLSVPVDFEDITGSIRRAVAQKPAHGQACTDRALTQIGG